MLAFLQRKLIYVPISEPVPLEEAGMTHGRIRQVFLSVQQNVSLHGWYCLADPELQRPARLLVILFPGNAGNRLKRVRLVELINELGADVLIFDYRGYGGSSGSPSEEAIASDCRDVWKFAQNELGFSREQIVIFGQSLGGGVATRLVWELCQKDESPAGLILQATFTSLPDAARVRFPWLPVEFLLVDRFPSIERISEVHCPLLVVHGRQDEIIPIEQGERLFQAAPDVSSNGIAKQFVELSAAGHNDILRVAREEFTDAKLRFLSEIERVESGEK